MKETILKVLKEISDGSQVNFSSESARLMIADKLEEALTKHLQSEIQGAIEDVVCGSDKSDCCEGDCHE
jgi:hypothetical protein